MTKLIVIGLIIILIFFLIYLGYQTINVFDTKSSLPFVAFAFTVILAGITYYVSLTSGKQSDEIQSTVNKTDNSLSQFITENTMEGQINFDPDAIHLGSSDWVNLRLGGPLISVTVNNLIGENSGQPIGLPNGTQPIKWEVTDDKLLISTKCYDIHNNWIVEVTRNYWRRNPNYSSKFNFDSKGFEVIDNQGNVVLSMDLRENNTILIQGYFISPDEDAIFYCGSNGMTISSLQRAQDAVTFRNYIKNSEVKYLFKYDRMHYMGVRNN